jgi:hypothetical protein
MVTPTDTICPWNNCYRVVFATGPWYPFCSTEHEQMQEAADRRTAAAPERQVTLPARQLTLDTSLPWVPESFPLGTPENVMHDWFEHHPNEHVSRDTLIFMVKTSLGRASRRDVMTGIMELRRAGWPIISSSGEAGYWYSTNPEEWDILEQNLRGRSMSMLRTISLIRRRRQNVGRVPMDDFLERMERGEV